MIDFLVEICELIMNMFMVFEFVMLVMFIFKVFLWMFWFYFCNFRNKGCVLVLEDIMFEVIIVMKIIKVRLKDVE